MGSRLNYFCSTYSPGASAIGGEPAATDPRAGRATSDCVECAASQCCHVGHQEPACAAVPSIHASGVSVSLEFNQVRTRWRRRGCLGPLTMPALWPPEVRRKV